LSTSGQGHLKIPDVDAITSASLLADVPKHEVETVHRIDAILLVSSDKYYNELLKVYVFIT